MTGQERNERCACGSGKKFKKCCLLKEWQNSVSADPPKSTVPNPAPTIVWHYTVGACIERILADRELRPSTMAQGREKGILWFSANPDWEPTAGKALVVNGSKQPLDRAGTEQWYGGLYRIGASPSVLTSWTELKQMTGYKPESITILEKWASKLQANPLDWWGARDKIGSEHWLTIEHFDDGWKELHQHDEISPAPLPITTLVQPTASEIAAFWASRNLHV